MRSFEQRVAVVTGGAAGIGRATAELLARKGCDIALVDLDEAGMAGTAERVRAAGRKVSLHGVDVSDKAQMQALPEEVLREHRRVHIVVNDAGVGLTGRLDETTLEDIEWIVGTNFWGVVYGCKFFLPHLQRVDEAHIVNLSSMLAFMGVPVQSAYSATKFAVRGLTEALYAELAGTRIGVTGVYPGAIRTDFVRTSRFYDEEQKHQIADRVERAAIPPERVARKILRAIERNRPRVIVGADAHALERIKRLFPVLSNRAAAWAYRRYGSPPEPGPTGPHGPIRGSR